MIIDYQKFVLPDENKQTQLVAEVNWNIKDEKSNGLSRKRRKGETVHSTTTQREDSFKRSH